VDHIAVGSEVWTVSVIFADPRSALCKHYMHARSVQMVKSGVFQEALKATNWQTLTDVVPVQQELGQTMCYSR
jgi:hypothetical protein